MFSLLLTILTISTLALATETKVYTGPGLDSLRAEAGSVFHFSISPQQFNLTVSGVRLRYRVSLLHQPALPAWLTFTQLEDRAGLLYGLPPSAGLTKLQILATDTQTFNTHRRLLSIHTTHKVTNQFQVNIKIDNLNIEDVFDERRKGRLLDLFKTRFWPEAAEDIHLSFADSALRVGGRRPLKPSSKDGVVVRLGSSREFSSSLIALDQETEPLRKHSTCSYKKISIERYFRQAGFAVDWCSFRLITSNTEHSPPDRDRKEFTKRHMDWSFPLRSGLERGSKAVEIISATVLPMVIFSSFLVLVCLLLFSDCGTEKEENSAFLDSIFDIFDDCGLGGPIGQERQQLIRENNNSVEMAMKMSSVSPAGSERDLRSSSVHRQTETMRALARRRDVTPRLQQTPTLSVDGSSLHSRSRTASPVPSQCGQLNCNPDWDVVIEISCAGSPGLRESYNWEMFESLNRPQPPAYNSLPRSGSSQAS